ncbi:uncharacterized protein LOC135150543 [Daucus carota subsp. sativus]|uniref:uncharacterized protein LOC135150543 n=1 Tax=Daucus carota subsp. sativus TaxID=79200 RepID=UPI003083AB10
MPFATPLLRRIRFTFESKTIRIALDENLIEICSLNRSSSFDSPSISRVLNLHLSIAQSIFGSAQCLKCSLAKLGFFNKFTGSVQSLFLWSIWTYLGDYSVVGLYLFAGFFGLLQNYNSSSNSWTDNALKHSRFFLFYLEDFTTRATTAGKDLMQKQKFQLTQLVYLLMKIEAQVTLAKMKFLRTSVTIKSPCRSTLKKLLDMYLLFISLVKTMKPFLSQSKSLKPHFLECIMSSDL